MNKIIISLRLTLIRFPYIFAIFFILSNTTTSLIIIHTKNIKWHGVKLRKIKNFLFFYKDVNYLFLYYFCPIFIRSFYGRKTNNLKKKEKKKNFPIWLVFDDLCSWWCWIIHHSRTATSSHSCGVENRIRSWFVRRRGTPPPPPCFSNQIFMKISILKASSF